MITMIVTELILNSVSPALNTAGKTDMLVHVRKALATYSNKYITFPSRKEINMIPKMKVFAIKYVF